MGGQLGPWAFSLRFFATTPQLPKRVTITEVEVWCQILISIESKSIEKSTFTRRKIQFYDF